MKPSHAPARLVRNLILMTSTVAIVGVVFSIYQYVSSLHVTATAALSPSPAAPEPPTDLPEPTGSMEVQGVPLGAGEKINIRIYERGSSRARMDLRVREWAPIGDNSDEFRLSEPEIRLQTPRGQEVLVTADAGRVELERSDGQSYDPRRGTLTGHVVIRVDRLTDQDRQASSTEMPDHERFIYVEFDEVEFDMQRSVLRSAGPVRIQAHEADLAGRGLLLRYNEVDDRIDYLQITEGDRIVLRNVGALAGITLAGSSPATAAFGSTGAVGTTAPSLAEPPPTPAPSPTKTSTPSVGADENTAASASAGDEEGPLLFVPDQPAEPAVPQLDTYRATFTDNIEVQQRAGDEIVGRLLAPRLMLDFDVGRRQRQAASTRPDAEPQEALAASAPGPRQSLVVNWSGPLVMERVGSGDDPDPGQPARFDVSAAGGAVRIFDRQGRVQCREFAYRHRHEQVRLVGTAEEPVVVHTGREARVTGREIFIDRRVKIGHIVGPGELFQPGRVVTNRTGFPGGTDDSAAKDLNIRFNSRLDLVLGTTVQRGIDHLTGELREHTSEYLESAVLTGDVRMQSGAGQLAGERVEIAFDPPRQEGAFADQIRTVVADGHVYLLHGDDRVEGDHLEVEMGPDPTGRATPRVATVRGQVVASRDARIISATDHMKVHFQSVPVAAAAPDVARHPGSESNLVPDAEDNNAITKPPATDRQKYRLGLERLEAVGDVSVQDPQQDLEVTGDRLNCTFREGRQIDHAHVQANDGAHVSVRLGEYHIIGQEVELEVSRQWARVPGAGRLTFKTYRDLDGTRIERSPTSDAPQPSWAVLGPALTIGFDGAAPLRLATAVWNTARRQGRWRRRGAGEPTPVSVTWSDRMTFHGERNTASIVGQVHAASESTSFDCRELIIDFADVDPAPAEPRDWWILDGLVHRSGRKADRDAALVPRLNKEPIYLLAEGDAVALTTNLDPRTGRLVGRGRIAGPRMAIDFRAEVMKVEGPGTLLIEDYQPEGPRSTSSAQQRTPFGGMGDSGPSQTFIRWLDSMSYYYGRGVADFEKNIELIHRSGAKMVLANALVAPAAIDDRRSRPGRDARLTCQSLFVEFFGSDQSERSARRSVGNLSGNRLAKFEAGGRVHFDDSGVSVACDRISYYRDRNLLSIFGTDAQPAEIIDQRRGFRSVKAPLLYWERDTNRIDAPNLTYRGR